MQLYEIALARASVQVNAGLHLPSIDDSPSVARTALNQLEPPAALHLRLPVRCPHLSAAPTPFHLIPTLPLLKLAARQHIGIHLNSILAPDEKGLNQQCKWHSISQSSPHAMPLSCHPWIWQRSTTTGSVHKAKQAMPMPCRHAMPCLHGTPQLCRERPAWAQDGLPVEWARRIAAPTPPPVSYGALVPCWSTAAAGSQACTPWAVRPCAGQSHAPGQG